MAHFNNISDDQVITPAVELAPAKPVTTFSEADNDILYGQTVSVLLSVVVEFSGAAIVTILTAARSCQLGLQEHLFVIGTILLKLGFMASGVENAVRFEKIELHIISEWLTRAIKANVYNDQEERFVAQMTLINIREMLFPAIDLRKENRRQTRREAEEDIFGRD